MNPLQKWQLQVQLKHKRHLSQGECADMLGYSESYYRKVWGGFTEITPQMKKRMKEALDDRRA